MSLAMMADNERDEAAMDRNLLAAVEQNDTAAVQRAIRNGANVDCVKRHFSRLTNTWHITARPLTRACGLGFEDIVRILLDAGANARWKNRRGWSAIGEACESGNLPIVEMLLNHDNGLLEITDEDFGWTPLIFAARYHRQTDIVRFLLSRGANVCATDDKGNTALMVACIYSSLESMRLLLAEGSCDLEARDNSQRTALHEAAFFGFIEGVRELLLDRNANMFAVDNNGNTPFDVAPTRIKPFLIEVYGSKMTREHGRLALHAVLAAAEYSLAEIDWFHPPLNALRVILPLGKPTLEYFLTLLHHFGTDLIANRDDSGKLPIHIACRDNAPVEVLTLLVEMDRATLQIADHHTGSLPIHLLCCNGTMPTEKYANVRHFVEQGGDGTPTARNHKGALPLHNLVASNNPALRTVQYLIQSFPGAVTARTDEDLYPFMVAACETSSASLSVVYELIRANPNLILPNDVILRNAVVLRQPNTPAGY